MGRDLSMVILGEQLNGSADCVSQLWLAAPGSGSDAAGISRSRTAGRALERTASVALLAETSAPAMPRRSLSHSNGCAAIAIAPVGCRAGIDIEVTKPRDVHGIAEFAFASGEAQELRALGDADATAHFYALWTLKEAFAKALGMPLLVATRECVFERSAGSISARVPSNVPWRAIVFAPRPTLTLAAVILDPSEGTSGSWHCQEWPETAAGAWPCLTSFSAGFKRLCIDR
jgi:4'-phosphopantetheinyl transferase